MSLHYLVKLEMFITQVLPLRCQRKKLQNLSHLNCGLQIRQIWIQLITACWKCCKRRCTKHASLIWMNRNSDWEWSGPSWIMSSLRQPFISGVVELQISVAWCFVHLSCNISHTLLSTVFKSAEYGGYSWGWINSGVSLSNNSIVACVRWAFQVHKVV